MSWAIISIWKKGHAEGVARFAVGVRARLFNLSAFMKEFKLRKTGWYNVKHGREGTLWEGRFKCVGWREAGKWWMETAGRGMGRTAYVAGAPR